MNSPIFSSDPNRDLIRRIVEARGAYEKLNGDAPLVIYVNGPLKKALAEKGLQEGGEVAGMKILASPESVADQAICSRDRGLFKPIVANAPKSGRKK